LSTTRACSSTSQTLQSFATLSISQLNVKWPRSAEDLRMPAELKAGAADVHDEHALRVVGIVAADAIEVHAMLKVRGAQRGLMRGQPGELAPVMLGSIPQPADDVARLARTGSGVAPEMK